MIEVEFLPQPKPKSITVIIGQVQLLQFVSKLLIAFLVGLLLSFNLAFPLSGNLQVTDDFNADFVGVGSGRTGLK